MIPNYSQRSFPWIWLSLVLLLAIGIAWYSFHLNNYAITPDFSGLTCAAQQLATEGHFSTYENPPFGFEMCWLPHRYVGLQLFHAALLKGVPLETSTVILGSITFAYLGLIATMAWFSWRITYSRLITISTATFTALCPAVIRSLVLTPQNLFGYLLIAVGMILALRWLDSNRLSERGLLLAISVLWLTVLGFTHDLSFGVGAIAFSVWFTFFYIRPWKYKVIPAVLGGVIVWLDLTFSILPVSIAYAWRLLSSNAVPGFYHPWWDHPAMWGYIITSLGVLGLTFSKRYIARQYHTVLWLLVLIAGVTLIMGHLPLVGLELLPNRFIPFAWIPLVVGTGIAVKVIVEYGRSKLWLTTIFLGIVVAAQLVHGIIFMHDDINGLSFRYRPSDDFIEAVQWVDTNVPETHLLGIQSATDQAILLAPQWFMGRTTYYPWFALNHRNVKKFGVVNESSPYSEIINQPKHPEYKRLFNMYTLITNRKSAEAKTAIETLGVDHLLVNKKAQPYTEIWHKETGELYPIVFENDTYILYEL